MATAVKVDVPKAWPTAQVRFPAVVGKIGVIIDPLATPPVPESGPSELERLYVEKTDPVCNTMPVPVVLSKMRTAGLPNIPRSVNVETITMESVNVAGAKLGMLIVAVPVFTKTSVKGAGPGVMFAVSPVNITVNSEFVKDVPPKVPEAVVVSE